MAKEISGKVIIVTGASTGIGRATARFLGRERARVALVARRQPLLEEVRQEVEQSGGVAISLPLDLRQKENVQRMIAEASSRFGRIDVLINNAGFGFYGTVESTPDSVVREIFALNFEAALHAIQLVVPIMRAQGGGHILNVSSVVGKRGLPLSGIYCATKFALEGLTESLRLELKDSGIDVSIVNPAATRTDFPEQVRRGDVPGSFKPIGHIQSAEEVAASIVSCIRNPKIEIYPYGISRALVWLNALAPSLADKVIMSYFRSRISAKRNA